MIDLGDMREDRDHSPAALALGGDRVGADVAVCDETSGERRECEAFRLAVPRRGHVLSTTAEIYGGPIRDAVGVLSRSLASNGECATAYASLFTPSRWQPAPDMVRSETEMAAWAMVSMWIVGVATGALSVTASLAQAEQWFFAADASQRLTGLTSSQAVAKAEQALHAEAEPGAFLELLPYILDPHGPGSRLSVRNNPVTQHARVRKRAEGVFYTPADVAEYMADASLNSVDGFEPSTMFDPACGTGVFLRAALKEMRRRYPAICAFELASEYLFGADIDPWPLHATAFVLLADIWSGKTRRHMAPAMLWHRLSENLVCIDALRIDPAGGDEPASSVDRRSSTAQVQRISISALFPALQSGPKVILGNPPYADLGERLDFPILSHAFKTVAAQPRASSEIYLAFFEQMTRLVADAGAAGALVLPLSIGCNIGPQFVAAREKIMCTPGHWRFAFFDREPHALFGEDVKTRNAIVLWAASPGDKEAIIATGPLRRWRGDSRSAMFESLRFTDIDRDIRAGIPKLEGKLQAEALNALQRRGGLLEHALRSVGRCPLAEVANADEPTVFVGPTAYNFLNVFPKPPRSHLTTGQPLSQHPLYAIRCPSHRDALIVFAILSSHLAYWWWHTHGDGFHVSRRFIDQMPFGLEAFTGSGAEQLAACGEDLWSAVRSHPIISLNRGRSSVAYTPNGHDELRRKADTILADLADLDPAFVEELQQFTAHTVAAALRGASTPPTMEKIRT